jgi:phosphotriesterase-related protein
MLEFWINAMLKYKHTGVRAAYLFFIASIVTLLLSCQQPSQDLITVNGPLSESGAGIILPHEHILVDFIGADSARSNRYSADSVMEKALPFLLELKNAGCQTFLDCTPNYIGRDVKILQRLSIASGLNIVTNTGYYGAAGQKFLPKHAFTESADQLAKRWISEFENGIDDTRIKPGFIKLGADAGSLTDVNRKIMNAGAIAHLQTGLTIAVHNGMVKQLRKHWRFLLARVLNLMHSFGCMLRMKKTLRSLRIWPVRECG